MEEFQSYSNTISNPTNESGSYPSWIKWVLIILVLGFLGINVYRDFFKPAVNATGDVVKQTSNITATGTKGMVDVANDTVTTAIDDLQKGFTLPKDASAQQPMPDKNHAKSGFCYVGEDRDFRTCIEVNQSDKCMSGDIFPTHAVCVNPNLRV